MATGKKKGKLHICKGYIMSKVGERNNKTRRKAIYYIYLLGVTVFEPGWPLGTCTSKREIIHA